jgi:hypothetical protein
VGKLWEKMRQISARQVDGKLEPEMYRVSDNLHLKVQLVNQATYKNFILRYMVDGKRLDRSRAAPAK